MNREQERLKKQILILKGNIIYALRKGDKVELDNLNNLIDEKEAELMDIARKIASRNNLSIENQSKILRLGYRSATLRNGKTYKVRTIGDFRDLIVNIDNPQDIIILVCYYSQFMIEHRLIETVNYIYPTSAELKAKLTA